MEKTVAYACPNPAATFSKGVDVIKQYYGVKNYKVEVHQDGYEVEFHFTKDSLYRRLVARQVPVIVGRWTYRDGQLHVNVSSQMTHGDGTLQRVAGKMTGVPFGFAQKAASLLTDPMFGKVFSEEFLAWSEAAADADHNLR